MLVTLIGWYDTVFTDIGAISWSTSALDNNYNQQQAMDTTLAIHGVALESQVVKEYQKADGVSSIAVLDKANQLGKKIYDARTSNWLTTVRPSLVNYSTSDLNDIENYRINYGDRVALPEDGAITIGSWTGFGYNDIPAYGTYGIIGGGLKGGASSKAIGLTSLSYVMSAWSWDVGVTPPYPGVDCTTLSAQYKNSTCFPWQGSGGLGRCVCWVPNGTVDFNGTFLPGGGSGGLGLLTNGGGSSSAASGNSSGYIGGLYGQFGANQGGGGSDFAQTYKSRDPIDMNGGNFIIDATDITIGTGNFPYSLTFQRQYSSSGLNQHGPLGRGWRHNWQIHAGRDTSSISGMGDHSVLGSSGTIVESFIAFNLQSDLSKPFDKYLISTLGAMWFVDNLSDNMVTINSGTASRQFLKLPDGSYASPAGDNGTLTKNSNNSYTYTSLKKTKLNFNAVGQLETWVEPFGMTVTLAYNTDGQLQSISNGLGRSLTLSYDSSKQLHSVSDNIDRNVTFTIDSNQNLTKFTDINNKDTVYEYDNPGRIIKIFRPANPLTPVLRNIYDSLNRVKEQQDYNNNAWQYFIAGSRSEEVNPNGKSIISYFNGMGLVAKDINQVQAKRLSYYDGRNRLLKVIAPEGNALEYVYDAFDRIITITAKAKPGSGLSDATTTNTYENVWNKLKTSTDAMSRVTTYNYDSVTGNLVEIKTPTVSGVGFSQIFTTYTSQGQVLTQVDAAGHVTKNTYSTTNETMLSSTFDYGTGRLNLTTEFSYNSYGDLTSVKDPKGFISYALYDKMRRKIKMTAPTPLNFETKYTYDDNSNLIKEERQTGDPLFPWQSYIRAYAPDGKVLTSTDPMGRVTSYEYDSLQRIWKSTDAGNKIITRNYDEANRLASITDTSNTVSSTYLYTLNGQIASIKNALNQSTTYTYDGFDRPKRTTYPDLSYEEFTSYNAKDKPTNARTRSGATIQFTYDELDRVKTKSVLGQPTVTLQYDLGGRITSIGTPAVSGDPTSGTFQYLYDSAGRQTKEIYPDGKYIEHEFDANGNVIKTTYPDGAYYVQRNYDELNRLINIRLNGASTNAIEIQYDALSRRKKIIYENGAIIENSFNKDDTFSNQAYNFGGTSLNLSYDYDALGRVTSLQATDGLNFMWHPGTSSSVTYGVNNALNQYTSVNSIPYTYNSDGCLTNDGTYKFEYNNDHLLTRVRNATTNIVIADYLYDPLLRQGQKIVGSAKTRFYYTGWQKLADYDGTTDVLQYRYVYGVGLDDILISISNGGLKTYYHTNYQNSVIATTDATGTIINRFKYGPFGETSGSVNSHGYSGQRYDQETGLYYFKSRYYSPKLGRFLQPDPSGITDNLNLYTYTANSPLNFSDPLGFASYKAASGKVVYWDPYNAKVDMLDSVLTMQFSIFIDLINAKGKTYQINSNADTGKAAEEIYRDFSTFIGAGFTLNSPQITLYAGALGKRKTIPIPIFSGAGLQYIYADVNITPTGRNFSFPDGWRVDPSSKQFLSPVEIKGTLSKSAFDGPVFNQLTEAQKSIYPAVTNGDAGWGFSSKIAGAQKGFEFALPASRVYFFKVYFELVPDTPKTQFAGYKEGG